MDQRRYHILTLGCQMNTSDSERLSSLLTGMGLVSEEAPEQADVIFINTCSVRQKAEDRVFGFVRQFAALKAEKPHLLVAVTGCMPGRDRDGVLRKKLTGADLYFPTQDMGELPRWLSEAWPDMAFSGDMEKDYLKLQPRRTSTFQAFVTIQTGCNKFCTYCVVPFSRGLEKNRPVSDILTEIRELAEHGCVEVTLLGQTVNSYRAPDPEHFSKANPYQDSFAALLWEVNHIPGISRIHFTAPHPLHMTLEIIDALALPAHLNFLHLPVQAGDNEVLRRMNRRYSVEEYEEAVSRIRARVPGLALGTDIIVGFCGETEAQFQKTVDLYERMQFDISYTAMYSPRSGTAAYRAFKDTVSHEEKKRRWRTLQDLQEKITTEKNQLYRGRMLSVLVERHEPASITDEMLAFPATVQDRLREAPGVCVGHSREMKVVRFPGHPSLIGKIVDVHIEEAKTWVLEGKREEGVVV